MWALCSQAAGTHGRLTRPFRSSPANASWYVRQMAGRPPGRSPRPSAEPGPRQLGERVVVRPPVGEPPRRELPGPFQLCVQERGEDLAGKVRGADVDPGVLVDLPAKEAAPIGSLLPDDL